jgi:transposase-like protein
LPIAAFQLRTATHVTQGHKTINHHLIKPSIRYSLFTIKTIQMPIQKRNQRSKAFHLYMTTHLNHNEIADAVGVNRRTVGNWVRNFNWAAQKRDTHYSPDQILHQLFEELRVIDQNINLREPEKRFATKEENELRTKLLALISGHMKNSPGNWRNIAPEYDVHNPNIIDLSSLSALEKKNIEKRQQAAEEDERLGPGKRFSEEELNDYYIKIANLKFAADSSAAKVGKDGKPLAEDDPQRIKWEDRMRQGKRPFVKDEGQIDESGKDESESGEKNSGRRSADGRSNDDLPEGETWMDMPEDDE